MDYDGIFEFANTKRAYRSREYCRARTIRVLISSAVQAGRQDASEAFLVDLLVIVM